MKSCNNSVHKYQELCFFKNGNLIGDEHRVKPVFLNDTIPHIAG
jgi:hypothetical protein